VHASVSISIGQNYEHYSFSSESWRDPGAYDLVVGCGANCPLIGATGCQSGGTSRAHSTEFDRPGDRSIDPGCANVGCERDGFD
jgi:hypothetical protein